MLTVALLLPIVTFAAWGVDLSAWRARANQLQTAADAAALAGTVWMPNLPKATDVALVDLAMNGFVPAPTTSRSRSPRVPPRRPSGSSLTDERRPAASSRSSRPGSQALSRSAEADYYLPLPLGSPLNYFGGDRTKTQTADAVGWPIPYGSTTWRPANASAGCNVGTHGGPGLRSLDAAPPTRPSSFTAGSAQCQWSAQTDDDAQPRRPRRSPTTCPCNRLQSPDLAAGPLERGRARPLAGHLHRGQPVQLAARATGSAPGRWPARSRPTSPRRPPANAPCMTTGELLDGQLEPRARCSTRTCRPRCWPRRRASGSPRSTAGGQPDPGRPQPRLLGPGRGTRHGDGLRRRLLHPLCDRACNCSSVQSAQYRSTRLLVRDQGPADGRADHAVGVRRRRSVGTASITVGHGRLQPRLRPARRPTRASPRSTAVYRRPTRST